MTKYVNNDYQSSGVRSINACPQPGFAEVELPDNHPDILNATGRLSPEAAADRDMSSYLAQTIFSELGIPGTERAQVRQALIDRHMNAVRIRNPAVGRR